MDTLELRNLNNELVKVNNHETKEMFYDETNNNLIIFNPLDEGIDTESICNGISNKAYLYLINELNANKNLVIEWSQIEGTTSDYVIYHDLEPLDFVDKAHEKIIKTLPKVKECFGYKYVEIKNGKERKITETIEYMN